MLFRQVTFISFIFSHSPAISLPLFCILPLFFMSLPFPPPLYSPHSFFIPLFACSFLFLFFSSSFLLLFSSTTVWYPFLFKVPKYEIFRPGFFHYPSLQGSRENLHPRVQRGLASSLQSGLASSLQSEPPRLKDLPPRPQNDPQRGSIRIQGARVSLQSCRVNHGGRWSNGTYSVPVLCSLLSTCQCSDVWEVKTIGLHQLSSFLFSQ